MHPGTVRQTRWLDPFAVLTQLKSQRSSMFLTTWKPTKVICIKHGNVINELTSRNSGKSTNTLEIKVDNEILISNPMDIAETINDHFTNVAQFSTRYSCCPC